MRQIDPYNLKSHKIQSNNNSVNLKDSKSATIIEDDIEQESDNLSNIDRIIKDIIRERE